MKYDQLDRAAFVLEEDALRQNLALISGVAEETGVHIILALKAFAFWPAFPIFGEYLPGATASSLNEAKLVAKHFPGDVHVYGPAYVPTEMAEVVELAHTITFNSLNELERHRAIWEPAGASVGLRFNPEYSPVTTDLYNPAAATGRLGETLPNLPDTPPAGLEGLHVHVLCESSADATETLIAQVESLAGHWLPQLKWLNLGGGHLMTRKEYDLERLKAALHSLRKRHPHLTIYMEPGSAHAWQTGVLVAHVLDIVENHGIRTLMLDVSFTCHMPDTLEMPYRPAVRGASAEVLPQGHPYRLGGVSCLAGDFLEAYWFEEEVAVGQTIVLEDMLHYTTVKSTMFNGVQHPDLVIERPDGRMDLVRRFSYEDYEGRMG